MGSEILLNITYKNWKICEKPSETNQINWIIKTE